jgi:TIR domain
MIAQQNSNETLDSRRFTLGSIFVNYRRHDSEGEAGRLFDELEKHFGEQSVFMDVAGIEPGQDFRKAIDKSVSSCSVLLAVIGPHWLEAKDNSGVRRLDDPADFVRIELASALRSSIPVVPVLVRGSKMPRADELPDDLKDLAYRNAVELTHARWKCDIPLLIRALRPHLGAPAATYSPTTEAGASPVLTDEASSRQRTVGRPVEAASTASPIGPQAVDRVTRELARYLGPIANVIVRRAAPGSASVDELCATVAREIRSQADRATFLRACRS